MVIANNSALSLTDTVGRIDVVTRADVGVSRSRRQLARYVSRGALLLESDDCAGTSMDALLPSPHHAISRG